MSHAFGHIIGVDKGENQNQGNADNSACAKICVGPCCWVTASGQMHFITQYPCPVGWVRLHQNSEKRRKSRPRVTQGDPVDQKGNISPVLVGWPKRLR